MMIYIFTLPFLVSLFLHSIRCNDQTEWIYQNDVYTGRHFNGLITMTTETDGYVINPVVLFLYAPGCSVEAIEMVHYIKQVGPPESSLIIAKHDYETIPKHIWYHLDDTDDLRKRYVTKGDKCLKVLFFQTGFHLTDPFTWHEDKDDDLLLWIWSFFGVNLGVRNSMEYNISVFTEGNGEKQFMYVVEPHKIKYIHAHLSRAITFYNSKSSPVYAFPVNSDLDQIGWIIDVKPDLVNAFTPWENDINNYWIQDMYAYQDDIHLALEYRHWTMAEVELITYKQPVMLFTIDGYAKQTIPTEVYDILRQFYADNQHTRISEGQWEDMEPAINTNTVQTSVIPLTEDIKKKVSDALLNKMESWCKCKLETTAFYGIREYYHGNILRMHVDNVKTHVISSILLIHKDLNQGHDWNLEIVDFKGNRQNITLNEGEMLLYESATLIHGRPLPYDGAIFANCFLHYMPTHGWKWQRFYEEDRPVISNGIQKEPIDVINTPFTLRPEHAMFMHSKALKFPFDFGAVKDEF